MQVTLTIIRYPKKHIFFALLAMALHRLPLWLNKQIHFYKLLGSGKNGTFDIHPDWQQWGILSVSDRSELHQNVTDHVLLKSLYGNFICNWLTCFHCETWTIFLLPAEGHGTWDGKKPFGDLPKKKAFTGPVATLTRATIRFSKLKNFWQNVDSVANKMDNAEGLVTSIGIGEIPLIKQATFSIWQNREAMNRFAYEMKEHTAVIQKTRQENWYSEDMFVRFKILKSAGTIGGRNPLEGKL